jgi:hypothetical protein
MFRLLVDTCVWLDLARDHRQRPLFAVLESLVKEGAIQLIVPRVIVDEFQRNEERIAKESAQSLHGMLRRVREAVEEHGDPKKKALVLRQIDDVNQKMPIKGGTASNTLTATGRLLASSPVVEPTEAIKARAADRALGRRAPFHHKADSMADAIIIETYAECLHEKNAGLRFGFVTHNTSDFSEPKGDNRKPHADLAPLFSRVRSLYFTKLADALRRASPATFGEVLFEHSYEEEPRGLTEILDALDLLFDQVWYNRHQNARFHIERGRINIVQRERYPRPRKRGIETTIQADVWERAKKAAKRVEKRRGIENLGPWTDFEWGMVNGKLSALRWVLGEEWDMLDT